jgi:hypothetical protein
MFESAYRARRLRGSLSPEEIAHPPPPLTPSELLHARLQLALEMCQLVLDDPVPPQVREPLACIAEFLQELLS